MKTAVVLSLAAILMVAVSATFFDDDDDFSDDGFFFDGDFDDSDDGFYFGGLGGMGGMGEMGGISGIAFGHGGQYSHGLAGGFGHIGNFIHKPLMDYGPWCNKVGGYGKVLAQPTILPSKVVYPSAKGVSSHYPAGGISSYNSGLNGAYYGSTYSGNTGYPASYSAGGVASYAGANQYATGSSSYQPVAQNYY